MIKIRIKKKAQDRKWKLNRKGNLVKEKRKGILCQNKW
jgi:hypothetical protein